MRFLAGVVVLFFVACGSPVPDEPTCSPSNCTGCCFNGACQAGITNGACGKGGVACLACNVGDVCNASAQACELDPQSNWKVQPVSATISTGFEWDVGGGAPDAFASLWCPPSTTAVTTPVANNSFFPTWTTTTAPCVMKAAALMETGFEIAVFDEDTTTNDTITMRGAIKVTRAQLSQGFVTLSNGQTISDLRVNLTRQ